MGYTIAKKLGLMCVSGRVVNPNDAVMFDIDETLVHHDGTPIEDMISLFKTCKKLGYKVILITARPDFATNHHFTLMQLIKYDLFPDEVYFVPAEEKTRIKEQTGLHYILSVGDLYTDLGGSDYFIKLPDVVDKRIQSNIKF
jgi:ribonucleotide monophosphatase NagD (HAD superfamily)